MKKLWPVVFLDRDGVVCKEKGYITSIEQLEIFEYTKKAIELIKGAGWKVIIITNQSAVARGMMTEDDLKSIHKKIIINTKVDAIYYCPHYPPNDNEDKLPYIKSCNCRKPNIELLKRAELEHNLNMKKAFFVGDRASDIMAGENIDAKTVLLESGYGTDKLEIEVVPDYIFQNLLEFALFLTT
jgi:D,D-heptose 1,7-bisphosphate phosphatase